MDKKRKRIDEDLERGSSVIEEQTQSKERPEKAETPTKSEAEFASGKQTGKVGIEGWQLALGQGQPKEKPERAKLDTDNHPNVGGTAKAGCSFRFHIQIESSPTPISAQDQNSG